MKIIASSSVRPEPKLIQSSVIDEGSDRNYNKKGS